MPQISAKSAGGVSQLPPYVSYSTLKRFIEDFAAQGVPARIDQSVFEKVSGTVRRQLIAAFRYLKLVDNTDCPNKTLEALVRSHNTNEWPGRLKSIIESSYPVTITDGLESATSTQFQERFSEFCVAAKEVRRKCSRFFLNASCDAGIEVSSRVIAGMKPRTKNARPRSSAIQKQRSVLKQIHPSDPISLFVGLFDTANLNPDETLAFLLLLSHLKDRVKASC